MQPWNASRNVRPTPETPTIGLPSCKGSASAGSNCAPKLNRPGASGDASSNTRANREAAASKWTRFAVSGSSRSLESGTYSSIFRIFLASGSRAASTSLPRSNDAARANNSCIEFSLPLTVTSRLDAQTPNERPVRPRPGGTYARESLSHSHGSRYCPFGLCQANLDSQPQPRVADRLPLGTGGRIPLDRDSWPDHGASRPGCTAGNRADPQPGRRTGFRIGIAVHQHIPAGSPVAGCDRACRHIFSGRWLCAAAEPRRYPSRLQSALFAQLRLARRQGDPQGHSRSGPLFGRGNVLAYRSDAPRLDRRVHSGREAAGAACDSRDRLTPPSRLRGGTRLPLVFLRKTIPARETSSARHDRQH